MSSVQQASEQANFFSKTFPILPLETELLANMTVVLWRGSLGWWWRRRRRAVARVSSVRPFHAREPRATAWAFRFSSLLFNSIRSIPFSSVFWLATTQLNKRKELRH